MVEVIKGEFTKLNQEEVDVGTAVAELNADIERYEQAIRDAEGALDSAEKELAKVLAELPE